MNPNKNKDHGVRNKDNDELRKIVLHQGKENEKLHTKINDLEQENSVLQMRLNEEVYLRITLSTILKTVLGFKEQTALHDDERKSVIDKNKNQKEQEIKQLKTTVEELTSELKNSRSKYEAMKSSLEEKIAENESMIEKLETVMSGMINIKETTYLTSELSKVEKGINGNNVKKDTVNLTMDDFQNTTLRINWQVEQEINILLVGGKGSKGDKTAFLNCLATFLTYESFEKAICSPVTEFADSISEICNQSILNNSDVLLDDDALTFNACSSHLFAPNNCRYYVFPVKGNVKIRFICSSILSSSPINYEEVLRCLGHFRSIHGFILFATAEDANAQIAGKSLINAISSQASSSSVKNIALVNMCGNQNGLGQAVQLVQSSPSNCLITFFNDQNMFQLNKELLTYLNPEKYCQSAVSSLYNYYKKEWKKSSQQFKKLLRWIIKCLEEPSYTFYEESCQTSNKNMPPEIMFKPPNKNAVFKFTFDNSG